MPGSKSIKITRSRDKLKKLYIHCNIVYGYQTWQGGDTQWNTSFHTVTRPFDYAVLQDHVEYQICYIATTTMPMITKRGKVVTYYDRLPSIK